MLEEENGLDMPIKYNLYKYKYNLSEIFKIKI